MALTHDLLQPASQPHADLAALHLSLIHLSIHAFSNAHNATVTACMQEMKSDFFLPCYHHPIDHPKHMEKQKNAQTDTINDAPIAGHLLREGSS